MTPQSNTPLNAKKAQSCALSTGIFAAGANFVRAYSCLGPADTIDFQWRDIFGGTAWLRCVEFSVMPLKHRKGRVTLTQTQDPAPGMMNHARGLEHQLLHHRLDTSTLGLVAHRRIGLVQGVLSNQAQQVHRHCGQLAHQIVGIELARGQTLQVHIGLELRMMTWGFAKLLMRGVIAVKGNHLSTAKLLWQSGSPALQYVLGQQQDIAVLIDGALGQSIDPARRIGIAAHPIKRQRFLPQAFALTHCVLVSATRLAAMASTGEVRGFHLMMKAISRATRLAWAVMDCISFTEQKPESARTSKGVVTKLAAMGKARSKLYSLSKAECCTPGRKANSRQ